MLVSNNNYFIKYFSNGEVKTYAGAEDLERVYTLCWFGRGLKVFNYLDNFKTHLVLFKEHLTFFPTLKGQKSEIP